MLRGTLIDLGGGILIAVPQYLLSMKITLLLDYDLVIDRSELVAVADVPLSHEVILYPNDLAEGLDEGDLALHLQTRVRKDGFRHDVLDEGQTGAEVDVFDVEGVGATKPNMHHAVGTGVSRGLQSFFENIL